MTTATLPLKRPPRNNHAVALVNRRRSRVNQMTPFSPAQRQAYARWMRDCRTAKLRGTPKPPEPWFIRMRRELLALDLDERVARTRKLAETAFAAIHAQRELLMQRPGPMTDLALGHAKVLAGVVADLIELAGVKLDGEEKKPAGQEPPDVTYL
jgi:hypothetical protein